MTLQEQQVISTTSIFGTPKKEAQPIVVSGLQGTSTIQHVAALDLARRNSVLVISDQQVVMFGSERQKAIGGALDKLLSEITKESNPVLFELFDTLKKGVGEADLPQLETSIREALATKPWHKILDFLRLSSAAKRIQAANERIGTMLTGKSKSLLDLTNSMEANIKTEVLKLLEDSKRLDGLAQEYRKNIEEFGIYAEAGRIMLEEGKKELENRRTSLNTADSLAVESFKIFEQKINLLEGRVLVLETILAKAPAELESIRISQSASLSTLGETANSALEEFTDIKSVLIRLTLAHQINTVQSINEERRKMRDSLTKYSGQLLEKVAVSAAKSQGINRLEDANRLLDVAKNLNDISTKVNEEARNNQDRFKEARFKLTEVKKLINEPANATLTNQEIPYTLIDSRQLKNN